MEHCSHCGGVLTENARFCTSCGAAAAPSPSQPQAAPQPGAYYPVDPTPAPKKGLKIAICLACAAVVAAIVLGVVLLVPRLGGAGANIAQLRQSEANYQYYFMTAGGGGEAGYSYNTGIVFHDNLLMAPPLEEDEYFLANAADGSFYVYGSYDYDSGLYDITVLGRQGEELLRAENVLDYSTSLQGGILYYQTQGRGSGLHRWTPKLGETLLAAAVDTFVVSPNDQYILYTDGYVLYLLQPGGTPRQMAEASASAFALAVSNDGNTIFYGEESTRSSRSDFICLSGGKESRAPRLDLDDYTTVSYNADCTEAVVCDYQGMWLVRRGQAEKLTDADCWVEEGPYSVFYSTPAVYSYVCAQETMDTFLFTEWGETDTLCLYAGGKGEKLASDVQYAQASEDYTTIVYLRGEDLYLLKNERFKAGQPVRVATGVDEFSLSRDGAHLYYTVPDRHNDDLRTLYYQQGTGAAVELAGGLGYFYGGFAASSNGQWCAYVANMDDELTEGDLYLYKAGGEAQLMGTGSIVYAVGADGRFHYGGNYYWDDDEMDEMGDLIWYDGSRDVVARRDIFLFY